MPRDPLGAFLDIAPFAEQSIDSEREHGFVWADPRDIHSVRVEYWHSQWPEHRIPRGVSGAGSSGWGHEGDWHNGEWRVADVLLERDANSWTYRFAPINRREFDHEAVGDFDATYRRTYKLRIASDSELPRIEAIRALTDSRLHRACVAVEWADPRIAQTVGPDRVDVFNGECVSAACHGAKLLIEVDAARNSEPASRDRTIVTMREETDPFSFAIDDLADGPLYIRDYGVLISCADEDLTLDSYAATLSDKPKNLHDRVLDEPEQTFRRAWDEQPAKRPFYMVLGTEGRRQRYRLHPGGALEREDSGDYIRKVPGRDTQRIADDSGLLRWEFGLPPTPDGRGLLRGYLPIMSTHWETGGVRYEQTAFATLLDRGLDERPIRGDDPVVVGMLITATNLAREQMRIALPIGTALNSVEEILSIRDDAVIVNQDGRVRAVVGRASAMPGESHGAVAFHDDVALGSTATVEVWLPYFDLTNDEIESLRERSFDSSLSDVAEYWERRIDAGTDLTTPEPLLNDYWRAHATHLLINHERHPDVPYDMARVGSFSYGVFANESVMQIAELDRRGLHDEARAGYEGFIHFQSSVPLKGDFTSAEGVLHGAGGYECLSYNQNHGWVLWGICEHYFVTRDTEWLTRHATNVIAACDWIIEQCSRTKRENADGTRPVEYGFLPAGELEDIRDFQHWLSTNAYTWLGLDHAAAALADIDHPDAEHLRAASSSMRADLLAGFEAVRVRSPVVRLSDGTAIPHVPAHQHLRGRSYGWIRETLEGAIHLIQCGLVEPDSDLARWIMQDYEDNLYLSEEFGYTVRDRESQWFSRGGFSMQPCLLCGPIPYLLRDQTKHLLRATFNAIAADLHADTRMLTEHPLPELGSWMGDHFKTSDEANAGLWLRLMFVWEYRDELRLGHAIPRAWLVDGSRIGVERAATRFGVVSLRVESRSQSGEIEARVELPQPCPAERVTLRLRHSDEVRLERVEIDGEEWPDLDPAAETITLPAAGGTMVVRASYA